MRDARCSHRSRHRDQRLPGEELDDRRRHGPDPRLDARRRDRGSTSTSGGPAESWFCDRAASRRAGSIVPSQNMQIGHSLSPKSPKSSAPMTGLACLTCSAPRASTKAGTTRSTSAGRVDRRRGRLLDLDGRLGGLVGLGEALDPALDAGDELLADRLGERPERELELDLVGDDVVLGPAVDRADRHDGRLDRLDLAADDRLEVDDDERRQDDRVDRPMGPGPVAPLAADRDRDRGRAGEQRTRAILHGPRRLVGRAVERQGEVGLGEARVEPIVEHGAGAADGLLGGLGDQEHGARPAILVIGQPARRADEAGHVHVVAAGVHHPDRAPGLVGRLLPAGVGDVRSPRRPAARPCRSAPGRPAPRRSSGRRRRRACRRSGSPRHRPASARRPSAARSRPPGTRARDGYAGACRAPRARRDARRSRDPASGRRPRPLRLEADRRRRDGEYDRGETNESHEEPAPRAIGRRMIGPRSSRCRRVKVRRDDHSNPICFCQAMALACSASGMRPHR